MEISYKLANFEGPLDLLLHLIEKNKVSIYDIPIVLITEQYLEYVNQMDHEDLDVVSDFLVMAATLLDIKSRMLLPKVEKEEEEDEEDPRAELVRRLLEYKMYKYMSYELRDRMAAASKKVYKLPTIPKEVLSYREPVDTGQLLDGLTLEKLNEIFQSVIRRQEDKVDPIRSKFGKIEKEEVSLPEKMEEIEEYARTHSRFNFRDLLEGQASKVQIIVSFLAILELMKMGKISIYQEHIFAEIEIKSCLEREKNGTE